MTATAFRAHEVPPIPDGASPSSRAARVPRLGRAVAVFVAVACGFTWLTAVPLMLAPPATSMPWYFYLGSAGPALGAVAAALILRPSGGLHAWALRTFSFRGIGRALAVALGFIVLYIGVGLLIELLATGSLERMPMLGLTTKLPGLPALVVLFIWVITFGLGEETGWRGWLMPALTTRFGLFAAALLVGAVWMLWHVPQFLYNPGFRGLGWGVIGWAFALIAGSFWLGWLAQLGSWSIIPVVVWHGAFDLVTAGDLGPSTFPATVSTVVMVQGIAVLIVLAVRATRSRASRMSTRTGPWTRRHRRMPSTLVVTDSRRHS